MGGEIKINLPNLEQTPIDVKNNKLRYGINKVQGLKKSLDIFNIDKTINISQDNYINILGIFDGHSGNEISQYISSNFYDELLKTEKFKSQKYKDALIETFINMDKSLRNEEINNKLKEISQKNKLNMVKKINEFKNNNSDINDDDINGINTLMDIIEPENLEDVLISDYKGSSGIVVLIHDNITYIANAGNSHFIIINKQLKINNSIIEKQNKDEVEEKKRIKIAKGIKFGQEIKNEEYLYTRGFGDFQYKINNSINIDCPEILSEPFLYEINNNEIKYIIIFNHGIYENVSFEFNGDKNNIYKNISDYFIEHLKDEKKPISEIIYEYFEELLKQIDKKDNNDNLNDANLSCVIIEFFS
jgi:serine/threonine protein phosphatase PrpC